jgi:hypothetical protein
MGGIGITCYVIRENKQDSFYPEDGGSTLLWNKDISRPQDFVLQWEALLLS